MKRILSLGLVFIMVMSLLATSFASSTSIKRETNREIGGVTILSSPPRIIEW